MNASEVIAVTRLEADLNMVVKFFYEGNIFMYHIDVWEWHALSLSWKQGQRQQLHGSYL